MLESTFASWVCCTNLLEVCQLRPKHHYNLAEPSKRCMVILYPSLFLYINLSLNQSVSLLYSSHLYSTLVYSHSISSICHHTGAYAYLIIFVCLYSILFYALFICIMCVMASHDIPGQRIKSLRAWHVCRANIRWHRSCWRPGSGHLDQWQIGSLVNPSTLRGKHTKSY